MSVVGAVVLTTVAEILMPEGKTAKYVKNTLSIFLVLIIISPISKIMTGEINFNNFFNSESYQTDYSFISKLNEKKVTAIEEDTENYLKSNGYENITVNILYTGTAEGVNIDYVHLDLTKFEFKDNTVHIYIIDNIIDTVTIYLGIAKENIYRYGAD